MEGEVKINGSEIKITGGTVRIKLMGYFDVASQLEVWLAERNKTQESTKDGQAFIEDVDFEKHPELLKIVSEYNYFDDIKKKKNAASVVWGAYGALTAVLAALGYARGTASGIGTGVVWTSSTILAAVGCLLDRFKVSDIKKKMKRLELQIKAVSEDPFEETL